MLLHASDGASNVVRVNNFIKEVKLEDCGLSYMLLFLSWPQKTAKQRRRKKINCTLERSGAPEKETKETDCLFNSWLPISLARKISQNWSSRAYHLDQWNRL